MRQLMFALAIAAWPAAAVGQSAADTVPLTVLVQGSNRVYGQQVSRAKTGTGFATETKAGGIPIEPLAGAVVSLKGGADLGATDEQGRVTIRFPRSERVDLVIRMTEFKELSCRVRVKERVDSIRAELLPVNGVAAWMPYGCKALR